MITIALALALNSVSPPNIDAREQELWRTNITPILKTDLWANKTNAYNWGHFLMVPLHAAFTEKSDEWQGEFADHFKRFMNGGGTAAFDTDDVSGRQSLVQYLYLHTRFIKLAADNGKTNLIPEGLPEWVAKYLDILWRKAPAKGYIGGTFDGIGARLQYKLGQRTPAKSYFTALIDEERFAFSEAADLRAYENKTGKKLPYSDTITDILQAAYEAYRERGLNTPGGGWILDAGAWADHPDSQFAGNDSISPNLSPSKRPGLGEDTSHSHRLPLWVTSLASAFSPTSTEGRYFLECRSKLNQQFIEKVLIAPSNDFPGYRTVNYMDGSNGVYRYGHATLGKDIGYGPWELSGTFLLGWWTFLDSDKIRSVYAAQAKLFPLPDDLTRFYLGAGEEEKLRAAVKSTGKRFSDLRELLCRLAAKTRG